MSPLFTTAICDPEAAQANPDAGTAQIFCGDSLVLAVRALKTGTDEPIERLYFRRPVCSATPCTADELNQATVIGWVGGIPFSVALDSRLTTVEAPMPNPSATWPASGSAPVPAIARPMIDGAPRVLLNRTPYPFCGSIQLGEPASVTACFRDAVIDGRPAEAIEHLVGDRNNTVVYRFDGRGAVHAFGFDGSAWHEQDGSLSLGVTPASWSFEPWEGTQVQL